MGTLEIDGVAKAREVTEVGFLGVPAVTAAALAHLHAALAHLHAARGRIVTVTSVGGEVGQPFNEASCAASSRSRGTWRRCTRWPPPSAWR